MFPPLSIYPKPEHSLRSGFFYVPKIIIAVAFNRRIGQKIYSSQFSPFDESNGNEKGDILPPKKYSFPLHCEADRPKQSPMDIKRIAASGIRPPRNDWYYSSLRRR